MFTLLALVLAASPVADGRCQKLDYRARVEVDAASLGPDGVGVASRLRARAEQELKRSDILIGEANELPVVLVKVVPLEGEDSGYRFTVDIVHQDASPIRDGSSVGDCPLCVESELLDKTTGATRSLAPKLRAYVADFNNRPCPQPAESPPPEPPRECLGDQDCVGDPNGERCHPVIKKCARGSVIDGPPTRTAWNPLMKGGVSLLAVGVVGVGVGVGLFAKKPTSEDPQTNWETTTTKTPGIALMVAGGTVFVVGAILTALGRRSQMRQQITPLAGPGIFGLSFAGRF